MEAQSEDAGSALSLGGPTETLEVPHGALEAQLEPALEGQSGTLDALPTIEPWRLNQEPKFSLQSWRPCLAHCRLNPDEWRNTLSHGAHPLVYLEIPDALEPEMFILHLPNHTGALEAHLEVPEAHPGSLNAHLKA